MNHRTLEAAEMAEGKSKACNGTGLLGERRSAPCLLAIVLIKWYHRTSHLPVSAEPVLDIWGMQSFQSCNLQ